MASNPTELLAIASSSVAELVGGEGAAVTSVNGRVGAVVIDKIDVGLANADNTSDANKPISNATQVALDGKEPTITPGTTGQYWRGDKTFQTLDKAAVGLGNVDNTSDANKPVSTAQQTALDLKANLASPALTGTPTAPTASPLDNSTKIATTAYTDAAVAASPGGSFAGAKVTRSTTQALTTGTDTPISWDTEAFDIGGYWAIGDPTKFTISITGYYLVEGNITFETNSTGERHTSIFVNGVAQVGQRQPPISANATIINTCGILALTAGDYVQLVAFQNSGGNLNALNVTRTHFAIHKIG